MKIKISLKCLNCDLKEDSFMLDTDVAKAMHFQCKECKSKYSIKVEEYEKFIGQLQEN